MRYGGNDPYIYENGILKNKLGAKTQEELDKQEKDITVFRIAQLRANPIQGNFDLKLVVSSFLHRGKKAYIVHIFQNKTQETPKHNLDLALVSFDDVLANMMQNPQLSA